MAKSKQKRLARKGIELTVSTFAIWLNPGAPLLHAILQGCFFVLEFIQADEAD